MEIVLKLLGQARSAAGLDEDRLECAEPATVASALNLLAQKHGDALRHVVLDENNKPHASTLLFLNDEQISSGTDCILRDGDELTIMPRSRADRTAEDREQKNRVAARSRSALFLNASLNGTHDPDKPPSHRR